MKFRFEYEDDATDALTEMLRRMQDMTPGMRLIAQMGEQQTRERFATETAPDGTSWEPSRRKKEKGGKTLTQFGHLGDSTASNYGNDFAEYGLGTHYADIHQVGGTILPKNPAGFLKFKTPGGGFAQVKSVTIPKRQILPESLEEVDTDALLEIMTNHLIP